MEKIVVTRSPIESTATKGVEDTTSIEKPPHTKTATKEAIIQIDHLPEEQEDHRMDRRTRDHQETVAIVAMMSIVRNEGIIGRKAYQYREGCVL